jgi:hypothetical protein
VGYYPNIEPNETFVVNLTSPTNATIAVPQGTGTILDDDGPSAPAAVPAIGTIGLALLGLAMAIAGLIVMRRN